MLKREANITNKVAKWFFKQLPKQVSGMAEIKHTRGSDTCNLNELKQNQTDYLASGASKYGFIKKHNDTDRNVLPDLIYFRKNKFMFVIIVFKHDIIVIENSKIIKYREKTNSLPLKKAEELADYKIKIIDL